jgi:hypothetical protein
MHYFLDNNTKIAIAPITDQFDSFSFYLKDAKQFSDETFLFGEVDDICKDGITSNFEDTSFRICINQSESGFNKISLFNDENIEFTINIKTEKLKENILRIQQSGINDYRENIDNFHDNILIAMMNPARIAIPPFDNPHFNHAGYVERMYGTPPGSPRGGQGI